MTTLERFLIHITDSDRIASIEFYNFRILHVFTFFIYKVDGNLDGVHAFRNIFIKHVADKHIVDSEVCIVTACIELHRTNAVCISCSWNLSLCQNFIAVCICNRNESIALEYRNLEVVPSVVIEVVNGCTRSSARVWKLYGEVLCITIEYPLSSRICICLLNCKDVCVTGKVLDYELSIVLVVGRTQQNLCLKGEVCLINTQTA